MKARQHQHISYAKHNRYENKLYRAMKEDGIGTCKWIILEEVNAEDDYELRCVLNKLETIYIQKYHAWDSSLGLNVERTGNVRPMTEELRNILSSSSHPTRKPRTQAEKQAISKGVRESKPIYQHSWYQHKEEVQDLLKRNYKRKQIMKILHIGTITYKLITLYNDGKLEILSPYTYRVLE